VLSLYSIQKSLGEERKGKVEILKLRPRKEDRRVFTKKRGILGSLG